jgi:hypothetical protein
LSHQSRVFSSKQSFLKRKIFRIKKKKFVGFHIKQRVLIKQAFIRRKLSHQNKVFSSKERFLLKSKTKFSHKNKFFIGFLKEAEFSHLKRKLSLDGT